MKIAIPHWQGRVSPVFDVAENLLVVELDDGGAERSRVQAGLRAESPHHRASQLAETGAEVLICGAISWPLEMALTAHGVRVIGQTCGNIEEVLAAFVSGRLSDGAFAMPGCCGRRRRGQGRGRGRCRGGRHGPPC
ncbi:MAG: dinitrogenase iron-molybdenum cofactor biosynthesis protein [Phycisphaerae bacterium]|nr:dinitrogenase iron-molybdenum cofactor biosynthesis protein [Phycisphaerae bacterium]